jgi:hypothetical protein
MIDTKILRKSLIESYLIYIVVGEISTVDIYRFFRDHDAYTDVDEMIFQIEIPSKQFRIIPLSILIYEVCEHII